MKPDLPIDFCLYFKTDYHLINSQYWRFDSRNQTRYSVEDIGIFWEIPLKSQACCRVFSFLRTQSNAPVINSYIVKFYLEGKFGVMGHWPNSTSQTMTILYYCI